MLQFANLLAFPSGSAECKPLLPYQCTFLMRAPNPPGHSKAAHTALSLQLYPLAHVQVRSVSVTLVSVLRVFLAGCVVEGGNLVSVSNIVE